VAAFPFQLCAYSTFTPPLAALRAQGSAQKSDADEAAGHPLEELTKGIVESNGLVRQKSVRLGFPAQPAATCMPIHADRTPS